MDANTFEDIKTDPEDITIKARDILIKPDYADGDLIYIDNIKNLEGPHPARIDMNIMCYVTTGRLTARLNNESFDMHAGGFFICPPNYTLSSMMVTPDFEYRAICVNNKTLQSYLRNNMDVWNNVIYIQKKYVFYFSDVFNEVFRKLLELMNVLLKATSTPETEKMRHDFANGVASLMLNGFCNQLRLIKEEPEAKPAKGGQGIFNRFLDILQHSAVKHQSVNFYASQLCISPKYLTTVCKAYSGKSAYAWISEYTLSDINYYLRNTDLSIKEVADKVGFTNSSFFGKYVKEHFGCSPLEYRKKENS